eukprot:TRINITY_DN37779_c0_g1_i2.p1 TRINITY_DN37779_c0_g1~~TRINITY_DN37779_c0_g1_i2.p1  ORF type:complete len:483 (-),score=81.27 TRINITY_DN37779_c0_g1_i2:66-1451(-)
MAKKQINPDAAALGSVLGTCEEIQNWRWAIQLLRKSYELGSAPDVGCFRKAISACEKEAAWQHSLLLLQELQDFKFKADALTCKSVMRACERGKATRHSLNLKLGLDRLTQAYAPGLPQVHASQKVGDLHSKAGLDDGQGELPDKKKQDFRSWKASMMERLQSPSVTPQEAFRIISLFRRASGITIGEATMILSYLSSKGLWKAALSWFELTKKELGVRPDCVAYSVAISACTDVRQWRQGLGLLDDMGSNGILPDTISVESSIRALGKVGQWGLALKMFESMPEKDLRPNKAIFKALLDAGEMSSKWELSMCLLSAMFERRVTADPYHHISAFRTCASQSQWQASLRYLLEERNSGEIKQTAHEVAIDTCLKSKQTKQAWSLFFTMLKRGMIPSSELQLRQAQSFRNDDFEDIQAIVSNDAKALAHVLKAGHLAPLIKNLKLLRRKNAKQLVSAFDDLTR